MTEMSASAGWHGCLYAMYQSSQPASHQSHQSVSYKMDLAQFRRVLALNLFILVQCIYGQQYRIPPVRIEVYKPKGFRASIEGEIVLPMKIPLSK